MKRMKGLRIVLFVVVVMFVVEFVFGNFVVEENSLVVMFFESLKGMYCSVIGNFGVLKYGGMLLGVVIYLIVNMKGCGKFFYDYF